MSTMTMTETTLQERIADFLGQKRIAVCGVSGKREVTANAIYRKLKGAGYEVFPVTPTATSLDGDPCYPDVASIPGGLDGAVIVTRPEVTEAIVRQCAEAGVPRVWMHQSLLRAGTSVSPDAVTFCHEHGIAVIGGACPMMFCAPVDAGHKCFRWMLKVSGGLPR